MRHIDLADIQSKGADKAAQQALTQLHADAREFVVHIDTDVLDAGDLASVNVPGEGGLRFSHADSILQEVLKHKNLLGLDIAQYNPDKDPDGSGAQKLVSLLVSALTARLKAQDTPTPPTPAPAAVEAPVPAASESVASHPVAIETPEPVVPAPHSEPVLAEEPAVVQAPEASEPQVDASEISSSQTSS
jgi:hypothetical protein